MVPASAVVMTFGLALSKLVFTKEVKIMLLSVNQPLCCMLLGYVIKRSKHILAPNDWLTLAWNVAVRRLYIILFGTKHLCFIGKLLKTCQGADRSRKFNL